MTITDRHASILRLFLANKDHNSFRPRSQHNCSADEKSLVEDGYLEVRRIKNNYGIRISDHGILALSRAQPLTLMDIPRFAAKIRVDPSGCWIWTGSKVRKGYGNAFWIDKMRRVSRISLEITKGPIPDGFLACHTCDNPPCGNPYHLFAGTSFDNMRDMIAKGRDKIDTAAFAAYYSSHNYLSGEDAGNAKLSRQQAQSLINDKAAGAWTYELVQKYKIGRTAVQSIVSGRTWHDLDRSQLRKAAGIETGG